MSHQKSSKITVEKAVVLERKKLKILLPIQERKLNDLSFEETDKTKRLELIRPLKK